MKGIFVITNVSPILDSKYSGTYVRVTIASYIDDGFVRAKEEYFNIGTINAKVVDAFTPFFKRGSYKIANNGKKYLDTEFIAKHAIFEMEYSKVNGVIQPTKVEFKGFMKKGYQKVNSDPLF